MNLEVVDIARRCLGTPFRHQGRLIGEGLDCAGLAVYVAASLNLPFSDKTGYSRNPWKRSFEDELDAQPCLEVVSVFEFGDLLLLRTIANCDPSHVAIYTDIGILHCCALVGKCCEHVLTPETRANVVKAYRFRMP